MATVDYEAIGAAIAARYAAQSPPPGETGLRLATDDAPGQVTLTPALVVFAGDEAVTWGPVRTRVSECEFLARLYLAQDADYPVRMARLSRWRRALLDAVIGQIQLGLAYVDWCELRAVNVVEAEYGGTTFDALEFIHTVRIREQTGAAA
jgi:hypothetical protein